MNNCSCVYKEVFLIKKDKIECCNEEHIHSDKVNDVIMNMPSDEELYDIAELFKVFGDSTRIKILYALSKSEMCVCDIGEILNVSQSAVSHQLRMLKQMQLVKFRREGKSIYYSLSDEHIKLILEMGMEHICE